MNLQTIIIVFLIVLVTFLGVIFFQFRGQIPGANFAEQTKKLQTTKVTVNDVAFTAEIATSENEKQKGLSQRKSLGQDQAMLFVFDAPGMYSFWMKDMEFPIDIIFINNNKIVSLVENVAPAKNENPPIYFPEEPVNRVLEVNAGLSKKHGFKKGTPVKIEEK